jgi:hypothetical protein
VSGGKSLTTLVLLETNLLILIVGKRVMHFDVQFCHSSAWFVADCVTPSQLAPQRTFPNHTMPSAQLLVFAPLQGNPRSELPSIRSGP